MLLLQIIIIICIVDVLIAEHLKQINGLTLRINTYLLFLSIYEYILHIHNLFFLCFLICLLKLLQLNGLVMQLSVCYVFVCYSYNILFGVKLGLHCVYVTIQITLLAIPLLKKMQLQSFLKLNNTQKYKQISCSNCFFTFILANGGSRIQ